MQDLERPRTEPAIEFELLLLGVRRLVVKSAVLGCFSNHDLCPDE